MSCEPFNIAITGDTGFDIYTEYVKGYASEESRVNKPEAAFDVEVPSGAEFTAIAFRALFQSSLLPSLQIEHLFPKRGVINGTINPRFTTLLKFLVELARFGKGQEKLRVKKSRPIDDRDRLAKASVFDNLTTLSGTYPNPEKIELLVIHDGAGRWRSYPQASGLGGRSTTRNDAMTLVRTVLRPRPLIASSPSWPRVLVNLSHDLPAVEQTEEGALAFESSLTFWRTLAEYPEQVCVVVSADTLRREGAAISRRLSWEQTVEDLAADMVLFDKLKVLTQFKHLIIRFGVVGAVHVCREHDKVPVADLVFAPRVRGGLHRDPIEDGMVQGQNVLLVAALARMMATQSPPQDIRSAFSRELKTGLQSCLRVFDQGYSIDWPALKEARTKGDGSKIISSLFKGHQASFLNGYSQPDVGHPEYILGLAKIPPHVLERPHGTMIRPDWEILHRAVNPTNLSSADKDQPSEIMESSRINVGEAIVLFGWHAVLNREWKKGELKGKILDVLTRRAYSASSEDTPDYKTLPTHQLPELPHIAAPISARLPDPLPIFTPIMSFGKLTVVERKEIESLRSIRNLFKTYHEECGRGGASLPPRSIAVFGPPGSGKSFAVKQIANEMNGGLQEPSKGYEPIEYNVAQFRSVEDLGDAIMRASTVNNEGKVPLIFFDEFDCKFGETPLGWLKYFLAPMQDGTFYGPKQTVKIARAMFVFAGGTHPSYNSFDSSGSHFGSAESTHLSGEFERRSQEFREQKGPDFISRLRGHIDILPINVEPGLVKPIIRRAIILRSLLIARGLIIGDGDIRVASIDEDILYALLTLDLYRHGTRSMEAILDMCSPMGERIEKASLPSRKQLHMHVDADAFFVRMYRGRYRSRRSNVISSLSRAALKNSPKNPKERTLLIHEESESGERAKGRNPKSVPEVSRVLSVPKVLKAVRRKPGTVQNRVARSRTQENSAHK